MLSSSRNTKTRIAALLRLPLLTTAVVQKGAIVVMKAGEAQGGHAAASLLYVGVAVDGADGPKGDSDILVRRDEAARFDNDAVAPITHSDIGTKAAILDDHTVSSDATGRSQTGLIIDVDADGVWIMVEGA
ncbi:MAG: hypothetical protein JKX72_06255 [Robiginitomaculum sp.]|nr:hypothetical protein [Robiginitomaculum sp.]